MNGGGARRNNLFEVYANDDSADSQNIGTRYGLHLASACASSDLHDL
jgi:hypothetical protein